MKYKLLSLNDLYNFYCTQNTDLKFDSSENGASIVVHIPESFNFSKNDNEMYTYGNFRLCHTEENRNGTSISEQAMLDAIPTAYNMPVLAYIYYNDVTEQKEFMGHEMHIDNDTGEVEYEEAPIGVIPESADLKLEYDEEMDKTYLVGSGIVWKNYSSANEILERMDGSCRVSVEIAVNKLSYDAKKKVLSIEEFQFLGVTLLGKNEDGDDILEGMEGSKLTLSDFSLEANSITNNLREGGNTVKLENNDVTVDNAELEVATTVSFDNIDANSVTESDVNCALLNESVKDTAITVLVNDDETDTNGTAEETETTTESETETTTEGETETTTEGETETTESTPEETEDDTDSTDEETTVVDEKPLKKNNEVVYTVTSTTGETKTFTLTLREQLVALNELVNATYGEQDQTYYDIDVDNDMSVVYMFDWWDDKNYKQQFKFENDTYELVGERTEVYKKYLTSEEIAQLEEMQANYALMEAKIKEFEAKHNKYGKYSFISTPKKKPGKYGTIFDK